MVYYYYSATFIYTKFCYVESFNNTVVAQSCYLSSSIDILVWDSFVPIQFGSKGIPYSCIPENIFSMVLL